MGILFIISDNQCGLTLLKRMYVTFRVTYDCSCNSSFNKGVCGPQTLGINQDCTTIQTPHHHKQDTKVVVLDKTLMNHLASGNLCLEQRCSSPYHSPGNMPLEPE